MTAPSVDIEGSLRPDGTLVLDSKPNLPSGRVRVTVQSLEPPTDVMDILRRIHAQQAASGYVPRTREQIDADIAAMRQEDEERMQAIEQLHEDYQHRQKPASSSEEG